MRRLAILAVACICGVSAMAEQYTLQRQGHPRLEMTAEEIEELRGDPRAVKSAETQAEELMALTRTHSYEEYYVSLPSPEFPPEHDDGWPYWTGLCGELRGYMEQMARAWVLTRNRTYLGWTRDLMLAVAGWRQWTDPWYGTQPCLDTHHLTRGMCVALDLVWHDLPDADRETILEAIATKGAQFIYEYGNDESSYVSQPGAWPNGYAMINTELGVAGLTLLGEDERAEEWLSQSLDKARLFFDEEGGVDGGLVEGFSYGSAAVDNLMYLVRTSDAIVGVNLFDHPYLSEAILFPAYLVVPGGGSVANFGDNGGPTGCRPTLIGLARAMVEVEESPVAAWYLMEAGEGDERARELAEPPAHLPLARHFRDIDWVAMRSGWGDGGSLLAFKSGHVAHHNHLDQNSFILACDDEWLLNDPGYQIYDRPYPPERNMTEEMIHDRHRYTYGSFGHNTILVDGEGQDPVRGDVVGFAATPAMDYAAGDASACYEELSRWVRHIVSVAPDYYVVFDDIATDGERRRIDLLLHTPPDGRFTVGGRELPLDERREASEARVTRTGEAAIQFLEPERLVLRHAQWPHCEEYGHYLEATPAPLTEATLAWVLRAGRAGEVDIQARPAEAEGATAVEVRIGHMVDTIALASAQGAATVRDVSLEGVLGMVRQSGAEPVRYALIEGTSLRLGGSKLIASDAPVSAGVRVAETLLEASVRCEEAAAVTLHCPVQPGMVRLEGIETPVDATFDADAGTVTLELPPGSYRLELREL